MNYSLLTIVHWEINVVFLTSLLFPVVTRFYWPWNESSWGWNIISLELSIAGCLLPSFLYIDFRIDDWLLRWSQVIFLAMVGVIVLWRAVIIWQTQRKGLSDKAETREKSGQSS